MWNQGAETMVASTPSIRHCPKQRHSPSLHRCGQVSLAIRLGEPGRKGRGGSWGEPQAEKQSVLCGLTDGKKGAETGANKLGPAWWGEILYLLPTWAGFLQRNNWHSCEAESTWSQPKALVIHLSKRKSLKKMKWVGKQKALAGEQPVTGIYLLYSSKWRSLICLALCKSL